MMMKGGNEVLARPLMMHTLETVKRKQFEKYHAASAEEPATIKHNPYAIFHQALKKLSLDGLVIELMIPQCREEQHWQMLMPEKLSHELLEAFHNQDPVIKKKHDMHKMAEASRALAHYHW
ncbi:28s ribosomal protein [Lynx pardinus]|uniref:28s ribosomal protein n=1 Tax=Lynx pardinus TaxID=191816 RepID=A0A485PK62_LYNPA|nr:28s ribosomal protein [Lynx pardinus]